jgi:hypothetical protein
VAHIQTQHECSFQARRTSGVTVKLAAVSVDCEDALTVGRFWSAALGRPLDPNPSSDMPPSA